MTTRSPSAHPAGWAEGQAGVASRGGRRRCRGNQRSDRAGRDALSPFVGLLTGRGGVDVTPLASSCLLAAPDGSGRPPGHRRPRGHRSGPPTESASFPGSDRGGYSQRSAGSGSRRAEAGIDAFEVGLFPRLQRAEIDARTSAMTTRRPATSRRISESSREAARPSRLRSCAPSPRSRRRTIRRSSGCYGLRLPEPASRAPDSDSPLAETAYPCGPKSICGKGLQNAAIHVHRGVCSRRRRRSGLGGTARRNPRRRQRLDRLGRRNPVVQAHVFSKADGSLGGHMSSARR